MRVKKFFYLSLKKTLCSNLKQSNGESLIDFSGEPDPEVCVDLVRVDHGLHQLVAEDQGQVTVLKFFWNS